MANPAESTAHEVHALLLEARLELEDANLTKAAHLAETAANPRDFRQMETFVAIRNLRTAIEGGVGADEAETLLMHAITTAEQWVRQAG